ncbi:Inner membrane protein yjdF [Salmonella enterica subsp. arizonae]|uniref:Inner membrane protein yjdF n=1 Tax=Salmonella enterica subsp. arizonae TaxID=59203 RepID=A0A2X4TJS3_SALER|nr:Inner membrane protein yjdF [Salmonella enterica subsp. arizonae]
MVGGMYTYAKVPIGFEVQEWLELSRNPYDKLGHFFQGLVPALARVRSSHAGKSSVDEKCWLFWSAAWRWQLAQLMS